MSRRAVHEQGASVEQVQELELPDGSYARRNFQRLQLAPGGVDGDVLMLALDLP